MLYVSLGISYKIRCAFSKEMSYSLNTRAEKVLQGKEMGREDS